MRVVDDRREGLSDVHAFHPPGHGGEIRDPAQRVRRGDTGLGENDKRQSGVANVELSRQPHHELMRRTVGTPDGRPPAIGRRALVEEKPLGVSGADGRHLDGRLRREPPTPLVVDPDHTSAAQRRREQLRLCREVVVHVGVKVQMVLRQVREPGDGEQGARDPIERVTRHLHGHIGDLSFAHHREQCLQVGGLRRGAQTRHGIPGDVRLDGADETGTTSRRAHAGLDEISRGRLAVRAGDTDDDELLRRVVVHPGSGRAGRRTRVGNFDHRRQAGRCCLSDRRRVGQDGDGAGRDGVGDEGDPVGPLPRPGQVDVSRANVATVVSDAGDSDGGVAEHSRAGQPADQPADLLGAHSLWSQRGVAQRLRHRRPGYPGCSPRELGDRWFGAGRCNLQRLQCKAHDVVEDGRGDEATEVPEPRVL